MAFPSEVIVIPVTIGVPALVVVAFRWFRHKELMSAPPMADGEHTAALHARLARIEQTLESVAIEVERVSEGQRFVTRLMADRVQQPPLPDATRGAPGRVNTPH